MARSPLRSRLVLEVSGGVTGGAFLLAPVGALIDKLQEVVRPRALVLCQTRRSAFVVRLEARCFR